MKEQKEQNNRLCYWGGKPYGISHTMLLELTSLNKPEYENKSITYVNSKPEKLKIA
jgi:hypothetical protein